MNVLTSSADEIQPSAGRRLETHAATTQPVTTLAVAVVVAAVGSFVMLLQIHWLLELPAALAGAVAAGAGVYAMLARPSTLVVSTAGLDVMFNGRGRLIAWADVASVSYAQTVIPDEPALINRRLVFRSGIQLRLRDGTGLFLPDCYDASGVAILGAIEAERLRASGL